MEVTLSGFFVTTLPRPINILPTANGGFVVAIGCAQLAFEDVVGMLGFLREYLASPLEWEKAYNAVQMSGGIAGAPRATVDTANTEREARNYAPDFR